MRTPLFNDNEFLSQDQLNTAAGLVSDSLEDITSALHTPGLIAASSLSFSYSNLTITVDAPLPFMALFSDGTLASANGTVDGSTSSSATVDFSSLVPSTGNVTAYLVAVSGSVAQSPTTTVGPPVGHPDFSPSFQPYTAYNDVQGTLIFSATTTAPDNTDTLLICSTVLSAGQTTITSSSTVGQLYAGAILTQDVSIIGTLGVGDTLTAASAQINGNATVNGLFTANYNIKGQTLTYNNTGLTVGWNFTNGQGEVDLLLGPQGGPGGLNIYQLNVSGDMVSTTPILALSNTGQLTIQGEAIVAPATQNNAAVQLGQLFIGNRKSVFTANGTFTVPSAVTTIWVSGCGGGGGGGGGNVLFSTTQGAGGGGGYPGSIAIKNSIAVTPGEVLTITVGAAGVGGARTSSVVNAGNGTAGGSSIVSSGTTNLITLGGGSGGSGATAYSITSVFGGFGYTMGLAVPDGVGVIGYGGSGGSGPFGSGGGGSSGNGASGSGSGGGGGGGGSGGNGSSGIIIIEW